MTTNNRKVSLKSVVQQSIEFASNNQNTLTGNSSTSTIDFLEIGTIIEIFPQIMEESIVDFCTESVQLSISIIVSSIVGEKEIRGNPYPIVSSRTYDYSVIIPSDYTLAIAGLSECKHITAQTKVPILGDIPILRSQSPWVFCSSLILPCIIPSLFSSDFDYSIDLIL